MKIIPSWLKTLFKDLEAGPGARLKELRGGAGAFVLGMVSTRFPVAFVVNDPSELFSWADELGAWRGRGNVYVIPPRADPILPWPYSEEADHTERYRSLARLNDPDDLDNAIFVFSEGTLMQKIGSRVPADLVLRKGAEADRDELVKRLFECGYQPTTTAYEAGEFAVRGGIVDVFPPDGSPIRIELDGDEVGGMRYYDPATQRSTDEAHLALVRPMAEVPLDEETRGRAAGLIEEYFDPERVGSLAERLRTGVLSREELSRYLPLFWMKPVSILDRLPPETVVVFEDGGKLLDHMDRLWSRLHKEYTEHPSRDLLPPLEQSYLSPEDIGEVLTGVVSIELGGPGVPGREKWPVVAVGARDNEDIREAIREALKSEPDIGEDRVRVRSSALDPLLVRIDAWRSMGNRVVLASPDGVGATRFEALLREHGIDISVSASPGGLLDEMPAPGSLTLALAPVSRGFRMTDSGWVVVAEEEIFGPKIRRARPSESVPPDRMEELRPGDHIVHVDHGIGIFKGITKLKAGGIESDCARIEYADAAILYLPVHRMDLIEPYETETEIEPILDKLGGTAWRNSLSKARKAIQKVARELVELYASRMIHEGHVFGSPDSTFREFEATFPYEETPDQARAIADTITDMASPKPMDRLICGDVGYGKTEVALRAAFLAAMEGKQVALLVPTTLLAYQHYNTFRQRLVAYPLRVETVSRLVTSAKIKQTLHDLEAGKVDIVIGTHRLLQKDVLFSDLGLLIIDEEHRFGVKHKEKIKEFKKLVDVLTLTATPIPRTLQLSMLGIWDISLIDTPPQDRLAVRTRVVGFGSDIMRDSIRREMSRGGQVFCVAPRIKNLDGLRRMIAENVPEARVGVAHGQMKETELEKVMIDFVEGRLDILLCTSIIESGIDIPRANTILIHNAHNFGLATLYQLRGRVGRSRERGYAYLMVPGKLLLSRKARERLRALEEFTELGSGYRIARLDLKIRGAGNILGESQTGHIHRIGYEMYLDLLQREVRRLKGEKLDEEIEPEIQIPFEAYLPEDYVPDPRERLVLYRRISKTRAEDQLVDLKGELLDRFGPLPTPVEALLAIISIKNILRLARVKTLKREGRVLRFSFAENAPVITEKILALVSEAPSVYKIAPGDELLFVPAGIDAPSLAIEISDVLKRIIEHDKLLISDDIEESAREAFEK